MSGRPGVCLPCGSLCAALTDSAWDTFRRHLVADGTLAACNAVRQAISIALAAFPYYAADGTGDRFGFATDTLAHDRELSHVAIQHICPAADTATRERMIATYHAAIQATGRRCAIDWSVPDYPRVVVPVTRGDYPAS